MRDPMFLRRVFLSVRQQAGTSLRAEVTATGHLGTPFGPSPRATTTLAVSPTPVNNTVQVTDTNGGSFIFSDSGSQTYEQRFTCTQAGRNTNTATILETGQESSASVEVNCDCSLIASETVCMQATVKITPNVTLGTIEYFCVGEPIIGPCPDIALAVPECTFTVSQNICVQIPLAFSVNVAAAPHSIVCGVPAEEICNPPLVVEAKSLQAF